VDTCERVFIWDEQFSLIFYFSFGFLDFFFWIFGLFLWLLDFFDFFFCKFGMFRRKEDHPLDPIDYDVGHAHEGELFVKIEGRKSSRPCRLVTRHSTISNSNTLTTITYLYFTNIMLLLITQVILLWWYICPFEGPKDRCELSFIPMQKDLRCATIL